MTRPSDLRQAIKDELSRLAGVDLDGERALEEFRKDFRFVRRTREWSDRRSVVWVGAIVALVSSIGTALGKTLWDLFTSHGAK